ncbi:MAG: hypothetical protein KBG15_17640, partial [Kofleriaceae bacterium]|nr:hypothetical protein [Kofleriaceae bacterium]
NLCRSYQNVQAYDQAHGAEAGAMAAAQVVAQRTVTRRSLDNGMVKFEVVLPSDEAAIVWAALNAAIAKASAAPTPAEPPRVAEPIPAEQTPEEPTPAEPTPAEHSPAELPTANRKGPTVCRPWLAACRCVDDDQSGSRARKSTPAHPRSKSSSPCRSQACMVHRNRRI